jgi:hypothetical protein
VYSGVFFPHVLSINSRERRFGLFLNGLFLKSKIFCPLLSRPHQESKTILFKFRFLLTSRYKGKQPDNNSSSFNFGFRLKSSFFIITGQLSIPSLHNTSLSKLINSEKLTSYTSLYLHESPSLDQIGRDSRKLPLSSAIPLSVNHTSFALSLFSGVSYSGRENNHS